MRQKTEHYSPATAAVSGRQPADLDSSHGKRNTSSVLRRFGRYVVIVALLVTIGCHWAVLQSIAWTTMLVDNLQQTSLTEAVSNTFDGEHPCPMCKHIDEAKKSEKKSDALDLKVKKFEFANALTAFVFTAPKSFHLLPLLASSPVSRSDTPPVPPPRAA